MRRQLLAGAAAACALLAAGSATAQTYNRLVVFGDSLTDNGNLFKVTQGTNPASPPYFNGRFSSGPVFVELLGFTLNGFGTVTGSTDYAFGGARTDLSASPPGMRSQLGAYIAAGGAFGPSDLVVVYGGANNIFQGIGAAAVSPNPVAAIGATSTLAAADIGVIINTAATLGAGTLLVPNLPSLGATPQFNGFIPANAPAGPLAEAATGIFNNALRAQVNAASAANASTNFIYMDVNTFDAWVRANPAAFGFTNVTTPCLNLTTGVACSNPDQFLYFDTVHPTAAAHRGLAQLTEDYIYYGSRGAGAVAMAETGMAHRESALEAALDRLNERRGDTGARFTMAVDGAGSTDDSRGLVPEIERDTASLRVSVDAAVAEGFAVGLQAHASRSEASAAGLEFEGDSVGVDAYIGGGRGPLFINAVVGASGDEYSDYRRVTGVGPIMHFADRVTGSSFGGKLQAGARFPLGAAELSPRVAVSAIRTRIEDLNENGPAARHSVRGRDIETNAAEATLRLESPMGVGRFRGHVEGGYGEFVGYDGDLTVRLVDNPARAIGIDVDAPGRGTILKAGLEGELFAGVRLGVGYNGRFDDEHASHTARLTVSYRPGS